MSKTDPNAYALHKIDLLTQVDGQDVPITAVIRKPFECMDAGWMCAASISGLIHRKADLERASEHESINVARSFLIDELTGFTAQGGQLFTANHKPVRDLRSVMPKKIKVSAAS